MNAVILIPRRLAAVVALFLGLLLLSACNPPPQSTTPPEEPPVETVDAEPMIAEDGVGAYVEPVVEAAPLGTSWGETVSSSSGTVRTRIKSIFPTQVVELNYSADQPRGQISNAMLLADHRVSVRVLREDGTPWPIYMVDGEVHLQGEEGERYTIELVNNSPTRDFGIVLSVDGLNVRTGRSVKPWGPGLALAAGDVWNVEGFRIDSNSAAAFRFSDPKDSVAIKRGSGSVTDAGVIGLRIYDIEVLED